jgi:hypothetical protein
VIGSSTPAVRNLLRFAPLLQIVFGFGVWVLPLSNEYGN